MLWVVLTGCVVAVDQTVTITDPVDKIVVDVTGGDLHVTGGPGPVVISADFGGPGGGPIDYHQESTDLTVTYQCDLCGGKLTLRAPPETELDVTVGAGDLWVDQMIGPIQADLSAGSAHVDRAGAGPVGLELDYGDLDASFSTPPDEVSAEIKTGTIDVTVPNLVPYALDLDAKGGRIVTNGITDDDSAPNTISLTAFAGDIHLTGR